MYEKILVLEIAIKYNYWDGIGWDDFNISAFEVGKISDALAFTSPLNLMLRHPPLYPYYCYICYLYHFPYPKLLSKDVCLVKARNALGKDAPVFMFSNLVNLCL